MMGISVKTRIPPEDVMNRGIVLNMRRNRKPVGFDPEDSDEFTDLRTRLYALRIKALSDPKWFKDYLDKSDRLVMEPYSIDGKEYKLTARPRDIARSLLVPALMFNDIESIIELIHESSIKAMEERLDSLDTYILTALSDLVKTGTPIAKRDDILGQLKLNLSILGIQERYGDIDPGRITRTLSTYGFDMKRSTGYRPQWDMTTKRNRSVLEDHLRSLNLEV